MPVGEPNHENTPQSYALSQSTHFPGSITIFWFFFWKPSISFPVEVGKISPCCIAWVFWIVNCLNLCSQQTSSFESVPQIDLIVPHSPKHEVSQTNWIKISNPLKSPAKMHNQRWYLSIFFFRLEFRVRRSVLLSALWICWFSFSVGWKSSMSQPWKQF